MKLFLLATIICCLLNLEILAQTCTATVSGNTNASALTWTSSGGALCPPPTSRFTAFTGNIVINVNVNDRLIWDIPMTLTGNMTISLANGATIEFASNVSVIGNMPITNTGTSALFQVNSGVSVTVSGDAGDATNNNVDFLVNGSFRVDGTLSGKNSNGFSGTGTISGGTLQMGNPTTCATPCPLAGGFTTCNVATAGFCATYGVTPIILSYFNISIPKNENRTLIEWATSSEENFSHFEIQRAGKDLRFNTILEVQGAGYNTNSLKEYAVYDENPLIGIGYYRLKAVDIDGTYEYFKVKSVNHGGGRRLLVSPNPTTGNSFTYSINWDPGLYDRISLLDAIGNEVYSAPVTTLQNELQINKTLRPGAYLLRYTGSSFQEVTRVFIKD